MAKLELNITELFTGEILKTVNPEFVQEVIKTNIEKTIKEEIGDLFSWNGLLRKQIKKFLEENISFDPGSLTVTNYNDLLISEVKTALDGMFDLELKQKAEDLVLKLISEAPKEIKFSELAELYKNYLIQHFEGELIKRSDCEGEVYFEISYSFEEAHPDWGFKSSFDDLIFSCDDIKGAPSLKIHLHQIQKDFQTFQITYCYFEGKMSGSEINLSNWGNYSELEQTLYKLQRGKSSIIEDEIETEVTANF